MANAITVEVDSTEARRFIGNVIIALRRGGAEAGPMRDFYAQAGARFLGFIRTRFVNASRGDGTWKPLATATKIKRLQKIQPARLRQFLKKTTATTRAGQLAELLQSRPFPILRDTSTLFASLAQGTPGNVQAFQQDGVSVGTNIKYAAAHQYGGLIPGRPPVRQILVPPDQATEQAILNDLANAVMRMLDEEQAKQSSPAAA